MTKKIDVLAIDDDKFIHKVISKTLTSESLSVRSAFDGESGIKEAEKNVPSIILLDVEMPGISGYEVCDRLRNIKTTQSVPIVFLSSHSSLRERLQGYEVGGDDYLIKPFEADHLLARISVLHKFQQQRQELQSQYELAQKTAMIALTGSGELGMVMQFLEKSLSYHQIEALTQGFFDTSNKFSLNCCLMITKDNEISWYSSEGLISPLEKELIEMCDRNARFLDFGIRTIINYPSASLLVKNMPLDDIERYGRMKDLLPIMLSAVNSKISTLSTQDALTQQNIHLLNSFELIRRNLYFLGSTIVNNRKDSTKIMNALVHGLSDDLLRMGLEEDQEEYLLNRVDTSIEEAMTQMDAGKEIRQALTYILANLKSLMDRQETLLNNFTESLASESIEQEDDLDDDIELF